MQSCGKSRKPEWKMHSISRSHLNGHCSGRFGAPGTLKRNLGVAEARFLSSLVVPCSRPMLCYWKLREDQQRRLTQYPLLQLPDSQDEQLAATSGCSDMVRLCRFKMGDIASSLIVGAGANCLPADDWGENSGLRDKQSMRRSLLVVKTSVTDRQIPGRPGIGKDPRVAAAGSAGVELAERPITDRSSVAVANPPRAGQMLFPSGPAF
jgi:hypothetical protein